jgi:hypothetical protein
MANSKTIAERNWITFTVPSSENVMEGIESSGQTDWQTLYEK